MRIFDIFWQIIVNLTAPENIQRKRIITDFPVFQDNFAFIVITETISFLVCLKNLHNQLNKN